jgi:hypothetical protein
MVRAVAWVKGKPAPILVLASLTTITAQLLLPLYYRRILLLADTPARSRRLGARLASQRLGSLLVVSRMILQFWER